MADVMMTGGMPQHTTYKTKYVEKHTNKENYKTREKWSCT